MMTSWIAISIPVAIMAVIAVSAELAWSREVRRRELDARLLKQKLTAFCKELATRRGFTCDATGELPSLAGSLCDGAFSLRFVASEREDVHDPRAVFTLRVADAVKTRFDVHARADAESDTGAALHPSGDAVFDRVYALRTSEPELGTALLDTSVRHALLGLHNARMFYQDGTIHLSWLVAIRAAGWLSALETGVDALAALARSCRDTPPYRSSPPSTPLEA